MWNGTFYNPKNNSISGKLSNGNGIDRNDKWEYEYKQGKIFKRKEYNEYGQLIFEGEYKEGERYKVKEYDSKGNLIFEGEYFHSQKYYGFGKEYDAEGNLIFEGKYIMGNKCKGSFHNKEKNTEKESNKKKESLDELNY